MRWAWIVILAMSCHGDEPNEERRLPKLQPPPTVEVPRDLQIPISIDGKPASALDATRLTANKPDYADDERSAWRLDALFRSEMPSGHARIAAFQDNGVSLALDVPAKDAVPVLLLNRRGQLLLTVVDPASPFPGYHGQGGRLARPGDPLPHIIVQRIEITNQP
jgi:hypothetical protein